MEKSGAFSSGTLAAATATILLARGSHPIMVAALRAGETAGWLAMLLAGLMASAIYGAFAYWTRRLSSAGLDGLARAAAGRLGAMLTACVVAGLIVFHAGLVTRETAEMAVGAFYPHTPETFPAAGLVLCTLYGAWSGLPSLIRLCRGFLLVQAIGIGLLLVGPIAWGSMRYLLPFWGPGPVVLLGRSVLLTAMFSPGVLFLLAASGSVTERSRRWWAGSLAILAATLVLTIIKVVLIKTYPMPLGPSITFPLHALARLITGGRFFERLEGMWVLLWVIGTACHLAVLMHVAAATYAGAFRMASHRAPLITLLLAMTTVAFLPPDQMQTIRWHEAVWPFGLAIGFGLPLALILLAALRGKLGSHAS